MKVEVAFEDIQDIQVATKLDADDGLVCMVKFQAKVHPGDIGKLLNLQKQFVPISCTMRSDQAQLDFTWHTVKETGEIDEPVGYHDAHGTCEVPEVL